MQKPMNSPQKSMTHVPFVFTGQQKAQPITAKGLTIFHRVVLIVFVYKKEQNNDRSSGQREETSAKTSSLFSSPTCVI